MIYALTFLEGILTFLSPCILPMVPVYLSYFGGMEAKNGKKTAVSSLGFILGFTVVFMAMGALSGTIGRFLVRYAFWFNLVCGLILVVFGLGQLGVIPLTVFRGKALGNLKQEKYGFFPSLLFGIVFSVIPEITWAPPGNHVGPTGKSRGPHPEITWAPRGNHVGPTRKSGGPHGEIILKQNSISAAVAAGHHKYISSNFSA